MLDCLPPVCAFLDGLDDDDDDDGDSYSCSDGCATCDGPGAWDCNSCNDGSSPIDDDGDGGGCCPGYCNGDDDEGSVTFDDPAYDPYVYPGFCPTPAPTMVPTPVRAISAATRTVHAFPFAALLAVLALAYI